MKRIAILLCIALVFLLSLVVHDYFAFYDGKLHMVFCDVGQGDAAIIKTPNNKVILIDSGPDKKVIDCLSSNMPFWQRNIDLMLLSHPHLDHFFGMHYVIDRYNVKAFATEDLMNNTKSYKELIEKIDKKKIPQRRIFANDVFRIGEVVVTVESPNSDYLEETSPNGHIGEHAEFASLVLRLSYGEYSSLLTGDSQERGLMRARDEDIDVLHVPHHGSATGLSTEVIERFSPQLAVISVGRKNRYGHPAKTVLSLLEKYHIPIKRTDQSGDIKIVSDGKSFWLHEAQ